MSVLMPESKMVRGMPWAAARSTTETSEVASVGARHNAIHARIDHRVDDLDLAREIGLLRRPLPLNLDVGLAARGDRAGMDALPKHVGDGFGNDANSFFGRAITAGGQGQAQNQTGWRGNTFST